MHLHHAIFVFTTAQHAQHAWTWKCCDTNIKWRSLKLRHEMYKQVCQELQLLILYNYILCTFIGTYSYMCNLCDSHVYKHYLTFIKITWTKQIGEATLAV